MGALVVVSNAVMSCTFGSTPAKLTALPTSLVQVEGQPAAVVTDTRLAANIAPFGMCSSTANPAVASATAAASGVLTPQPCVPTIVGQWMPGAPTVFVGGQAMVNLQCRCTCAFGGQISVTSPGSTQTQA